MVVLGEYTDNYINPILGGCLAISLVIFIMGLTMHLMAAENTKRIEQANALMRAGFLGVTIIALMQHLS